jgi:hypothetical protein
VSEALRLITPPAAEPVSLSEFKDFLELDDSDDHTRDNKLTGLLLAAREACEKYCRIRLITQIWMLRMDSFPGISIRYDRNGFSQYALPFPPFQSIVDFSYIDTAGVVQPLTRDPSYGTDPSQPFYGYQLTPGGGIQPAWLTPPWARPWPPQRMVPANTTVQWRLGFGGPLTVSIDEGSKVLTVPGVTFNPDDAPQIEGDQGTRICINKAGASGGVLETRVASVDGYGVATLADAAAASVAGGSAWLGEPIPEMLKLSIMFHAQFFYEQGAVVDQAVPRVVDALRGPFRNLTS